MKYIIFVLLFLLGIPLVAHAQVRITEIAWMGTAESQFGEWIELYNDGSESVNLAGWKLFTDGGSTLLFTLSKSIPAHGYLLVERTTASTPDPIPQVQDESGTFGGGGLANTGEYIVLKDTQNASVQSLDFASGWPAGDATTKQTMQLVGNSWNTAIGTPKAANAEQGVEIKDDAPEVVISEKKKEHPKPTFKPVSPHVVVDTPEHIYRGMNALFSAHVALVDSFEGDRYWTAGKFVFNMGNGESRISIGGEPISYIYRHPGTYTVSVQYYRNANDTLPLLSENDEIEVSIPSVGIEIVNNGEALKLQNKIRTPIDLTGWRINEMPIPTTVVLAPEASITIDADTVGFSYIGTATLKAPDGEVVSTTSLPASVLEKKSVSVLGKEVSLLEDVINIPTAVAASVSEPVAKTTNRTKTIVIGAVILFVISLYLLLERFMAQQE